ncbi:ATP-binding protein [Ruficoccus amylovorans]|uniref:ATP-binding protein n=1 Tax=Ruficoccus amylovorans TaxID=1804625 RepID=A0A842HEK3_9BACT|nr:ATP-binding protein [Ruficoccus amylovorans]MBC2593751.1 ATP-binding protein [Ruficoccus amylovorans]
MDQDYLNLNVKPHLIEDLGVNLYTSLSKALVEFVANSHDADATYAKIYMDSNQILEGRKVARKKWELKNAESKNGDVRNSLERASLDESIKIVIEDDGHGMTRQELQEKFLEIGRRRRGNDLAQRSPGKRVIMGRKGLGKLAGFGIAHKMTVASKSKKDNCAREIVLDYEQMLSADSTGDIRIPIRTLDNQEWAGGDSGTIITLNNLTFSGTTGAQSAAINTVAEYFRMVDVNDFSIWKKDRNSEDLVEAGKRDYVYGFPERDNENDDFEEMVSLEVELGDEKKYTIKYRIRFTPPKGQLRENERGIRIYAHGRLAAAPSLFEVKSSANGYQYTSYMDGVCIADFIDEQPIDYIATDRQGLRWETQFLKPLHSVLQTQILNALNEFAKSRDESAAREVRKDLFTKETIDSANLPKHRETLAYKIAVILAKATGERTQAKYYKQALPLVVKGLGKGDILDTISSLAALELPDLSPVVKEITELTKQEFGDFLSFAQGRIDGIVALKKICKAQDFKKSKKEKELQKLFEDNPWLIDPTFFQFMSADQRQDLVNQKLAQSLKIGDYVEAGYDPDSDDEVKDGGENRRPDLVFLLNNDSLKRIVIVELKAPNVSLNHDHLMQLKDYIRMSRTWLKAHKSESSYNVTGMLIGCRNPESKALKIQRLQQEEEDRTDGADWVVYDIFDVLERSENAHRELVDIYSKAESADDSE